MYNCIIVEDETIGQLILKRKIELNFPEIRILHIIDNVKEAVIKIQFEKPDLVFMDVQINGGTGLDILTEVDNSRFETIFVTSYDDFAIEALNSRASYYLLKPLEKETFVKAISKVLKQIQAKRDPLLLLLPAKGFQIPVNLNEVIYLKSSGSNTKIICDVGEYQSSRNLGYYEKTLPPKQFIRTHHSFLVNVYKVEKIIKGRSGTLIMKNGVEIPISQRRIGLLSQYFID